jgi:hypothetical protein
MITLTKHSFIKSLLLEINIDKAAISIFDDDKLFIYDIAGANSLITNFIENKAPCIEEVLNLIILIEDKMHKIAIKLKSVQRNTESAVPINIFLNKLHSSYAFIILELNNIAHNTANNIRKIEITNSDFENMVDEPYVSKKIVNKKEAKLKILSDVNKATSNNIYSNDYMDIESVEPSKSFLNMIRGLGYHPSVSQTVPTISPQITDNNVAAPIYDELEQHSEGDSKSSGGSNDKFLRASQQNVSDFPPSEFPSSDIRSNISFSDLSSKSGSGSFSNFYKYELSTKIKKKFNRTSGDSGDSGNCVDKNTEFKITGVVLDDFLYTKINENDSLDCAAQTQPNTNNPPKNVITNEPCDTNDSRKPDASTRDESNNPSQNNSNSKIEDVSSENSQNVFPYESKWNEMQPESKSKKSYIIRKNRVHVVHVLQEDENDSESDVFHNFCCEVFYIKASKTA